MKYGVTLILFVLTTTSLVVAQDPLPDIQALLSGS